MLHSSEERFLAILAQLGAKEVATPRIGDVPVYQVARVFAHGAILINSAEIVHAYFAVRCVLVSGRGEPLLGHHPARGRVVPRAVRYFDLWG
jgi:hypothetical protein